MQFIVAACTGLAFLVGAFLSRSGIRFDIESDTAMIHYARPIFFSHPVVLTSFFSRFADIVADRP